MSLKVKPTAPRPADRPSVDPAAGGSSRWTLPLVALGTVLVLVTYVTPMVTIPATSADLHAGGGARAWLLSSMSVGLAAALLASGAIGDDRGRRRVYVLGLAVMAVGALAAAVSGDTLLFVLARIVQGAGGAAVLACGLALLAAAYPPGPARASATAVWGASVGGGITLGVVLAAGVGTHWRAAYVVVAVLSLVSAGATHLAVPESAAAVRRRVDLTGMILLAVTMTLAVSALTEARSGVSGGLVALTAGAVVLGAGFVLVEHRAADPLLDLGLLRSPAFVAATIGSLTVGAGIIGMASNAAAISQQGLGDPLWRACIPLLTWSVVSVLTSLVMRSVKIAMSGPSLIALSLVVVTAGQLLGRGLVTGSAPERLIPAFLLSGLATGVLNAVLGRESVASVPADRSAMGSGANNTARYLGAACGITVVSIVSTHTGSGVGAAALLDGWNAAVLVSAALTALGAVCVGLVAVWGARVARSAASRS